MYLDEGGDWKPQTSWECVCERAQQVAIALRQKLADEKTANECLQDELTVLRAEREAAMARAEKAEGENAILRGPILATFSNGRMELNWVKLEEHVRIVSELRAELTASLTQARDTFNALDELIGVLERAHIEAGWIQVAPQFVSKMRRALAQPAATVTGCELCDSGYLGKQNDDGRWMHYMGGDQWLECESQRLTPPAQGDEMQLQRAAEALAIVCQKLISYRDRNGALNFQLEKADDFINMMRPYVDQFAAVRGADGEGV